MIPPSANDAFEVAIKVTLEKIGHFASPLIERFRDGPFQRRYLKYLSDDLRWLLPPFELSHIDANEKQPFIVKEGRIALEHAYVRLSLSRAGRNGIKAKHPLAFNRVLIQGAAGAGKSTLVQHMAEFAARAMLNQRDTRKQWPNEYGAIPSLCPMWLKLSKCTDLLKSYVDKLSLLKDLEHQLPTKLFNSMPQNFFERRLEKGRCLVILDGFDEVADTAQPALVDLIKDLATTYEHRFNYFVVTTRDTSPESRSLANYGFELFALQDMNEEQQRLFVEKHYDALAIEFRQERDKQRRQGDESQSQDYARQVDACHERKQSFLTEHFPDPNLDALKPNPLLLWLIVYFHSQGKTLPSRRVDLYSLCIRDLIQRRSKLEDENFPGLTLDQKLLLLGRLAFERHVIQQPLKLVSARTLLVDEYRAMGLSLTEAQVEERLRWMIEQYSLLQSEMPRTDQQEQIYFRHQTFRHYLTAYYINATPARVPILQQNVSNSDWREIWRLYSGIHDINEVLDKLREKDLIILAGYCIADANKADIPGRTYFIEILEGRFEAGSDRMPNHAEITELLALIGNDTRQYLLEQLTKQWTHNSCLRALIALQGYARTVMINALMEQVEGRLTVSKVSDLQDRWIPFTEALGQLGHPQLNEMIYISGDKKGDIKPFRFAKYPVTNQQYASFLNDNPSRHEPAACRKLSPYQSTVGMLELPTHPVVDVTWHDAVAYCEWLTMKSNRKRYFRLPTEQEWEWAAQGQESRRKFPWGSDFEDDRCNGHAELKSTSPVGLFPRGKTIDGLMDMAGNVKEWTSRNSKDDEYAYARGGSWEDAAPEDLNCMARRPREMNKGHNNVGFRVLEEISK